MERKGVVRVRKKTELQFLANVLMSTNKLVGSSFGRAGWLTKKNRAWTTVFFWLLFVVLVAYLLILLACMSSMNLVCRPFSFQCSIHSRPFDPRHAILFFHSACWPCSFSREDGIVHFVPMGLYDKHKSFSVAGREKRIISPDIGMGYENRKKDDDGERLVS